MSGEMSLEAVNGTAMLQCMAVNTQQTVSRLDAICPGEAFHTSTGALPEECEWGKEEERRALPQAEVPTS